MITVQLDDKEFSAALRQLIAKVKDPKATNEIFKKAAQIYITAAQANIDRTNKAPAVVKRYSTPKISGRLRAPNGMGHVVAEYHRGNLSRSIKNIPLRRMKTGIVVGPKASRVSTGKFATKGRVDGWYAHMVEYGTVRSKATPFAEPAWDATKGQVQSTILQLMKQRIENV